VKSNQDPQGNSGPIRKRFNWNLLGQLLAAAGVVVSLIFVGYEIRQNTAVARSAAAQAFTQQIIDINAIIVSGDIPQINARLEAGGKRADFTPEEQFILDINLISLVRVWESLFRSVQEGIVERELLEPIAKRGQNPFFTPYFTQSWPRYKDTFSQDFVTYFESKLNHLK
jgi:hypothetical protein